MKRAAFSAVGFAVISCLCPLWGPARTLRPSPSSCRIQSTTFEGWKAEQLANPWVTLTIVPQLGGRLMQVVFGGHSYLFVNPQYLGQYFPPQEGAASRQWINYGGDKVWPMPEGTKDEQHWAGPVSGPLDDGAYTLRILPHEPDCAVELVGPPDPQTGLQYSRDIRVGSSSPEIFFHAVMKNVTGHPLRWSMQSVTQYDTADRQEAGAYNHDFWAFTPANPESIYLEGYHVRDGPASDPSFSIRNSLFTLHWLYLQSEVWIDSPSNWVAVVDNSTQYAMIERFHPRPRASYPGKATVIFYTNGPSIRLNEQGAPEMTPADPTHTPYYMEAELNSPMANLAPGNTYAMDTEWFPTRLAGPVATVTYAGAVSKPIQAAAVGNKIQLSGAFGVFFPGELIAHFYDQEGMQTATVRLQSVSPLSLVTLQQEIDAPPGTARVSIHLEDQSGSDRGLLGEAWINPGTEGAH